ncbi:MAG: efflux RND transporter periplasmic adaptor subunit [Wenzhouxiangellaceae bacterium]|nr:efflux RND transporter periplasmic adaptor subunit [Wenzhouxiangellaceae bacterium]
MTSTSAIRLPLLATLALLLVSMSVAAQPLDVIVARAEARTIADPIEALGTLRANESAQLTSTITETISEIRFSDGERVTRGQVLVAMTNREQLAELAAAEAEVREAERQFERVQELADRGQESRALLDQRRRELDTASARLRAVDARLSDRLIKAPFDGVVGLRNVSVGSLLTPGTPVTTVVDDSVMKLDFPVPELFLSQVEPGLKVEARTRAFPGESFTGQVESLGNEVDPVTRAFQVRAEIPNDRLRLKPGMLMTVTLDSAPREAVLIPEEGLTTRGRRHFVLVVTGSGETASVRQREVEIGARRPSEVEVRAGLTAGERIVVHGGFRLGDGDEVRIRAEADGNRTLAEILAEGRS